jgi:hypothetical protein
MVQLKKENLDPQTWLDNITLDLRFNPIVF